MTHGHRRKVIDIPEPWLVRLLIERLDRMYDAFGFVFDDVFRTNRSGWQYLFLGEIPRLRLGLEPNLQPGDIDVLIVPYRDGKPAPEFAAAIEVKRLPLRNGLLGKNVGRYGITQAEGLLRDGFPLVGILHVIVCEPGPPSQTRDLQIWRVINDEGHAKFERTEAVDMTGSMAADLQIARLRSRLPNQRIGLNAIALQKLTDGGFRPYPSYGRVALMNNAVSNNLQIEIEKLAMDALCYAAVRK